MLPQGGSGKPGRRCNSSPPAGVRLMPDVVSREEDNMIEITRESAYNGLKAIVEEFGDDFAYQRVAKCEGDDASCNYVRDGGPSCLIGQLLASVGIPLERLDRADSMGGTPAFKLIEELVSEGLIAAEPNLGLVLSEVQTRQ